MAAGKNAWTEARQTIQKLLDRNESILKNDAALSGRALVSQSEATMHLPAEIGELAFLCRK